MEGDGAGEIGAMKTKSGLGTGVVPGMTVMRAVECKTMRSLLRSKDWLERQYSMLRLLDEVTWFLYLVLVFRCDMFRDLEWRGDLPTGPKYPCSNGGHHSGEGGGASAVCNGTTAAGFMLRVDSIRGRSI